MSEPYPVGLWYISYFLSDHFDNFFRSWASPIKVAFTAGLGIGLVLGYSGRNIRDRAVGFASGVNERLTWRSVSLQLDGDFEEAKEEMLARVSTFFADDNELFSRLKTRMNCPTIEVGDIRSLMEDVAPRLIREYNNDQLSVANFFSKVIEFLKDSKKVRNELDGQANGLTRRCFKADILLIYADGDSELAREIKTYLQGNDISGEHVEDVGIGQPKLSRLTDVFKQYIYVYIIVTKNLTEDVLAHYSSEMSLVNSLYNAKGRLIPAQTTNENNPVYETLTPWRYGTESSRRQVEGLIQNANNTLFQ